MASELLSSFQTSSLFHEFNHLFSRLCENCACIKLARTVSIHCILDQIPAKNAVYMLYMTIYLVISLPMYIHRIL